MRPLTRLDSPFYSKRRPQPVNDPMSDRESSLSEPPTLRAPASDYISPHERGVLHAISSSTGALSKGLGELEKAVLGASISAFRLPPKDSDSTCFAAQQTVKDCLAQVYRNGESIARKEDAHIQGKSAATYEKSVPPPVAPSNALFRTAFHKCDASLATFVQCAEASTAEYAEKLGKGVHV